MFEILKTISPELRDIVQILILSSFIIWIVVGYITALWFRSIAITRADFFAVLISCVWLFSLLTSLDISFWFDIIGAMATVHLIGEKSAKTFLDFIIRYQHGKWE